MRGRREPCFVSWPYPPGSFAFLDDARERRPCLMKTLDKHPIETGSPPANRRYVHHTGGSNDPSSLPKRLHSIVAVTEVVDRAEEENGVHGAVSHVQVAGVADLGVDTGVARRDGMNVVGNEVSVYDLVPMLHQPVGVAPRSAADVRDDYRRGWKSPLQDLDRSEVLDSTSSVSKALGFFTSGVIRLQLLVGGIDHDAAFHLMRLWFYGVPRAQKCQGDCGVFLALASLVLLVVARRVQESWVPA